MGILVANLEFLAGVTTEDCAVCFCFVLLLLLNMLNLMNNDCRLVEVTTRLPVTNRAVCLHGLGQG